MNKRQFSIIIISLLLTMTSVKASTLKQRLDSLIESKYIVDAPGCAILIANHGKIIYEKEIGIADMSKKTRIDSATSFNIASISKQFTVVGILKCQEMGLLDINDKVNKYLPELTDAIWDKIRICHLMSHTSGIPDNRPRTDREFMLHITDDQCLEYLPTISKLKFEPGSEYDYINPTFQILREIIQRVSKQRFDDFQQNYIFNPSQMRHTCYFEPNKDIKNMAHAYITQSTSNRSNSDTDSKKEVVKTNYEYIDGKGNAWTEYDYGEETFFATKADGGIYTNIHDFLKWEQSLSLCNCISDTLRELAYTPHIEVYGSKYCDYQNRPFTHYGYGWFIDNTPNRPIKIYHTGDNGGYQAYAAKYPTKGINVIMFENRNDIDRWSTQIDIENILIEEGLLSE